MGDPYRDIAWRRSDPYSQLSTSAGLVSFFSPPTLHGASLNGRAPGLRPNEWPFRNPTEAMSWFPNRLQSTCALVVWAWSALVFCFSQQRPWTWTFDNEVSVAHHALGDGHAWRKRRYSSLYNSSRIKPKFELDWEEDPEYVIDLQNKRQFPRLKTLIQSKSGDEKIIGNVSFLMDVAILGESSRYCRDCTGMNV